MLFLRAIQRGFQDAVAAADIDGLDRTDSLATSFREALQRHMLGTLHERNRTVRNLFDLYYARGRESERMRNPRPRPSR